MTTNSDLATCASSSDHEICYQRALWEYRTARAEHRKRQDAEEVQCARNVKLVWCLQHDMEEAEHIRKAEAVQAQRDKWKAVSAHYYLKHPEIKEKKSAKMAEKGAAHKLARCWWDPPKVTWKPDGEGQLGDFSGTLDLDPEDGGPGFPNKNNHEPPLGKTSKDAHTLAPPNRMYPSQYPVDGTSVPFSMRSTFPDHCKIPIRCLIDTYSTVHMVFTIAPSSSSAHIRSSSPLGPSTSIPHMNGMLACFGHSSIPTAYRSMICDCVWGTWGQCITTDFGAWQHVLGRWLVAPEDHLCLLLLFGGCLSISLDSP
ncbi:hypothetical protein B0H14DRAFT_3445873 [Mycena olivaceomarginata]|nr:hypothetical protein B0H14DRAFT_3445873 [Mycena olivaceomarginata]